MCTWSACGQEITKATDGRQTFRGLVFFVAKDTANLGVSEFLCLGRLFCLPCKVTMMRVGAVENRALAVFQVAVGAFCASTGTAGSMRFGSFYAFEMVNRSP